MKVKILGFELEMKSGVSVGEFYQQLESYEDKEIIILGKTNVIYTDVIDGYICGIVLNYKSNKKSIVTTRDSDGDLMVRKDKLKKGEKGTEVSLFVINPETMKGLFYSYAGATSPSALGEIFKKCHQKVHTYKVADYKSELTNCGMKDVSDIAKKVRNKFPGKFDFTLLVTPSDLSDVLQQCKEVSQVTVRARDVLSDGGTFAPLDSIAKKSTVAVDIDPGADIGLIRKVVKNVFKPFVESEKENALRIYGTAYDGESLSLKVGENCDHFGWYHYDEFVDYLPKRKWKKYKKCEALGLLIKKMCEHSVVFGSIPKKNEWKLKSVKDEALVS